MDLSPINFGFQAVLKQMLSGTASARPSATAFQGAAYFQVGQGSGDSGDSLVGVRHLADTCPSGPAGRDCL